MVQDRTGEATPRCSDASRLRHMKSCLGAADNRGTGPQVLAGAYQPLSEKRDMLSPAQHKICPVIWFMQRAVTPLLNGPSCRTNCRCQRCN